MHDRLDEKIYTLITARNPELLFKSLPYNFPLTLSSSHAIKADIKYLL